MAAPSDLRYERAVDASGKHQAKVSEILAAPMGRVFQLRTGNKVLSGVVVDEVDPAEVHALVTIYLPDEEHPLRLRFDDPVDARRVLSDAGYWLFGEEAWRRHLIDRDRGVLRPDRP